MEEFDWVAILTSIQDHIWLDVTGCQCREELGEQARKSIVVSSILLVQTVVKVKAKIQTAAVDNQSTVPEPHILEEVSVALHICSKTLNTHGISGSRNDMEKIELMLFAAVFSTSHAEWLVEGMALRFCRHPIIECDGKENDTGNRLTTA